MPDNDSISEARAIVRLEVQVEGLVKSVHDLRNLITSSNAPTDIRLNQHEKTVNLRLDAIESNQKNVLGLIEKLSDKIEAKTKFPFGHALAFTMVLISLGGGIGGFVINGIRGDLTRIERDITQIQSQVVPRMEHQQRWSQSDAEIARLQNRIESLEGRNRRP